MRFSSGTGAQDLLADKLDVRLLNSWEYTSLVPVGVGVDVFLSFVALAKLR
jgi:hypothetical protein